MTKPKLPTLFIPHGGGPCFFMEPMPGFPPTLWNGMANFLRAIPSMIGTKPKAVLVISAHWECVEPTVLAPEKFELLYDYYGFPAHTYQLTYPASGARNIASRIQTLLEQTGLTSQQEHKRGLDHGVFIPFKLIYPDADIPIVQLSLLNDLDPARHITLGRALAPLRSEGVLIVGSGLSYHNLRDFFRPYAIADEASVQFDTWLGNAITATPATRENALIHWQQAPGAKACHPRSEHLLPLMVVAGAAGESSGKITYRESLMGKMVSAYQFG
ncbi:MAG: class III extradiol ring-cleavage dioxygenase [Gallionellaceae bacterium]|nr:class III extradiol ring-cleavage dioxygenase [Gallionellaceae bacterium]